MRPARDTFLHFLSDNLTAPLVVHNIRKDINYPSANQLQMNAINVQFLADSPRVLVSDLLASIDIIFDDELTAIDNATAVFKLMSQAGYTPLIDYRGTVLVDNYGSVSFGAEPFGGVSSGTAPVALGSNLIWNPDLIKFRQVYGDTYFRYSASVTFSYQLY